MGGMDHELPITLKFVEQLIQVDNKETLKVHTTNPLR